MVDPYMYVGRLRWQVLGSSPRPLMPDLCTVRYSGEHDMYWLLSKMCYLSIYAVGCKVLCDPTSLQDSCQDSRHSRGQPAVLQRLLDHIQDNHIAPPPTPLTDSSEHDDLISPHTEVPIHHPKQIRNSPTWTKPKNSSRCPVPSSKTVGNSSHGVANVRLDPASLHPTTHALYSPSPNRTTFRFSNIALPPITGARLTLAMCACIADRREFLRIGQAVGMGFLIMGVIGYVVKLSESLPRPEERHTWYGSEGDIRNGTGRVCARRGG